MTSSWPTRLAAFPVLPFAVGLVSSVPLLGIGRSYGYGPIESLSVPGEWWLPLFFFAGVALGWAAGRVYGSVLGLALAAAAPLVMVYTVIAIKVIRWPGAPAVGDGFHILSVGYALSGILGWGIAGLAPRFVGERGAVLFAAFLIGAALLLLLVVFFVGRILGGS